MDERKIDSPPQRGISPTENPPSDSRSLTLNGAELRIDSGHVSANIGVETSRPTAATAATPRTNSQLLLEAGRLLEQMEIKEADLAHRQALLEEQFAQLESEKRLLLARREADEAMLEEQRQNLKLEEARLTKRLEETKSLLIQIDAARVSVEQQQADIELRRASLVDDVQAQFKSELEQIAIERQNASNELRRAKDLTAALEARLHETTVEAERLIQAERERLWQTLIEEWETRRAQFQQDHDTWLAQVGAEKLEIEREKAFYEAAVQNAEADFAAAKLAQEAELKALRDEQIAALQDERAQLLDKIQAERDEWERTQAEQLAEFEAAREQHSQILQAERAELAAERAAWDKQRGSQAAELQGERSVLEGRIRFQQDHLEKLRAELERTQNDHRRDRQIERQRLEDDGRQIIRRMRQIDLYRSSIDEREKSLERERDVLEKTRRAFSSSVDQDRQILQREQIAWQNERQIQQAELLRQQELYTSHAEGLESRRIRLERLRNELEETHRATLEMRLAVEEAWVELTQAAGQDLAREKVEQVRNTLVGYYRQLHDGVVEQRREHLEAQTRFERLRAEFHDERQKLMDWISGRDQELRLGEERLRLATAEAAMRDAAWQSARDRWMQEKAEAEQVIRKLLSDLGNQHRDPDLALPPTMLPIATIAAPSSEPGSVRMD